MIRRIHEWLTRLTEGVVSPEDEAKIAAWQDDRRREEADRTFTPSTARHLEPSPTDLDAIRAEGVADDDQPVEHTPRSLRRINPDEQAESLEATGRHARRDDIEHHMSDVWFDWLVIEHRLGIDLLRAQLIRMRVEATA